MKFSVIIPVYNVEAYIEKCLISVKNQTLSDFECLIVNDGTKDNSVEVAQKTIGDDPRFTIFNKPNGGLSDARNYGLKHASGEYVFFLDSDDYIDSTLLEKTYQTAKKYNSDIVCFDLNYDYGDRLEPTFYNQNPCITFELDHKVIYYTHSANNKIFKAEFLKEKEFIKGIWYEDLASVPVWMAKANNVSYINEPLYYYVQRQGSISHTASEKIFDIYTSIGNIRNNISLNEEELFGFYYPECVIMTTLSITSIADNATRKSYYLRHFDKLEEVCPNWYSLALKQTSDIKRRIVFYLMKKRNVFLLDLIYFKNRSN